MEDEKQIHGRVLGQRPAGSVCDAYVTRVVEDEVSYAVLAVGESGFPVPLSLLPTRTARGVTLRISIEAITFPTPADEARFAEENARSEAEERRLDAEAEAEIRRRADEGRAAEEAQRRAAEEARLKDEDDARRRAAVEATRKAEEKPKTKAK